MKRLFNGRDTGNLDYVGCADGLRRLHTGRQQDHGPVLTACSARTRNSAFPTRNAQVATGTRG